MSWKNLFLYFAFIIANECTATSTDRITDRSFVEKAFAFVGAKSPDVFLAELLPGDNDLAHNANGPAANAVDAQFGVVERPAVKPPAGPAGSLGVGSSNNNSIDVNSGASVPSPAPPTPRKRREDTHRIPAGTPLAFWYWTVSALLVIFAGFASGLTVGLMSLDPMQLKVLEVEGTEEQKRGVRQVSDVIRRHHLLLVTLLLANSVAMETLPIFLDRLIPSWAAILISVTAILLFGEIIPQALCTGPNQLYIAQAAAPFVSLLIGLLFVIAWPIAKLLDYLLGDVDHHSYYARAHLKALIRMHERERRIKEAMDAGATSDASSALGADEVVVIEGALDLATKTLKEIMLPIENVFMLDVDTLLDRRAFERILHSGHSRVPVYTGNRDNIKGLLLTKSLLAVDPNDQIRAGELLVARRPIFSSPETNLYDLLNEFQKGHSHIAFVTNQADEYIKAFKTKQHVAPHARLMGIATLEDVIEELIQEEIYDEFDQRGNRPAPASTTAMYGHDPSLPLNLSSTGPRKRSSQMLFAAPELAAEGLLATAPAMGSVRELPEIVQQLNSLENSSNLSSSSKIDLPSSKIDHSNTSSSKEHFQKLDHNTKVEHSAKKYGPGAAPSVSFPSSMTTPLVPPSPGRGTPISSAVECASPLSSCKSSGSQVMKTKVSPPHEKLIVADGSSGVPVRLNSRPHLFAAPKSKRRSKTWSSFEGTEVVTTESDECLPTTSRL